MKKMLWIGILIVVLTGLISPTAFLAKNPQKVPALIEHLGQPVFLSGMNIAWINFGRDLDEFDENKFQKALDDVMLAGGNCVRWWLHVNGSKSPIFSGDGYVSGLSPNTIPNLKKALDLAYERGIVVILSLWSFDMLQNQGQDLIATKRLIQDKKATRFYIKNALTPLVEGVKGHPAILAWEVCNEPEGMLSGSGWSAFRTEMKYIQQFVNLIAGAIHRIDRKAKVTNGSNSVDFIANSGGMFNHYSDKILIKAGGDKLGTLDFYQVHFYPEHADEMTSPFHHPASYWKVDKPLLIGEFPAKGILTIGKGFRPKTTLTPEQAYQFALENGYAGALGWTWTNHDGFGGVADAAPGMMKVLELAPDKIKIGNINKPPALLQLVKNLTVDPGSPPVAGYADLTKLFYDFEDKTSLKYTAESSNPELVQPVLESNGMLGLKFTADKTGSAKITVTGEDSGGKSSRMSFMVFVPDPRTDNLCLGKPVTSSTNENEENKAEYINDGNPKTRWSSIYANNQWIYIDLLKERKISKVRMTWEVAYGRGYRLEVSNDAQNWKTIFEEANGDGNLDEIILPEPVTGRYIRMYGVDKGTQWGFSIWEFEVYQEK